LEFVTFHVALGSNEAVHPNQTLAHQEYLSMIDMMFASARLFHPSAKRTVLTDTGTDFGGVRHNFDQTVRSSIDGKKMMLERANAQLQHVRNSEFKTPMVILDSDILINGSLLPIFDNDFDVALTWRANEAMPINGGFLLLNNVRPAVTRQFFERFTRTYHEKYMDQATWFGDQLALRDCVGLSLDGMGEQKVVEVEGCRILLLPCDIYNYSPKNQYAAICTSLPDKAVLHFKGERKRLMRPFWRAWLQPRGSYAPWVHFNGWRQRQWLHQQVQQADLPGPGPAGGRKT